MALRQEFDVEIGRRTNSDYAEFRSGIDLGYAKSIVTFVGRDWHLLWCVAEGWVTTKM